MEVKFTVPGKPEGKGRPKFARRGNYVQTYTPDKTVVYENWVRECWVRTGARKLEGEIEAEIVCYFPIPKSVSKKRRAQMEAGDVGYTGKPDTDNVAKSCLDSISGLAYDDDKQITRLVVVKRYAAEPRVEITLNERETEQ